MIVMIRTVINLIFNIIMQTIIDLYQRYHGIDLFKDVSKFNVSQQEFTQYILKCLYVTHKWSKPQIKLVNGCDIIIDNEFIAQSIVDWISSQKWYEHTTHNDKIGKITYYGLDKHDINDKCNIVSLMYEISKNFPYVAPIVKNNNEKQREQIKVNVYLISTPFNKHLPNNENMAITPYHINSGMSDGKNIYVWRDEEMQKVLIHELVHHYKLDFSNIVLNENTEYINNMVYNKLRLQSTNKRRINEAFTELLATLINCVVKKNVDFERYLVIDTWHSFIQVAKLLKYAQFNCTNDFFCMNCDNKIGLDDEEMRKFREQTNMFQYYVVKSLFLFNLPIVFEYITKQKTTHNYEKLIRIILLDVDDNWKYIIDWIMQQQYIIDKNFTMTCNCY
jgi:hypothetical protein